MAATQNQTGLVPVVTYEDLSDSEGYLVVLVNDSGTLEARLPDATSELATHVVVNGNTAGEYADVEPLDSGRIVSVKAKGTGNPGALLVLADPATAADAGKVLTDPGTRTAGYYVGIALESWVDGQLVRVRPVGPIPIAGKRSRAQLSRQAASYESLTGSGTWDDLTLTNEEYDDDGIVAISGGNAVIEAGTYELEAVVGVGDADNFAVRLYDNTNTTELTRRSGYAANSGSGHCEIVVKTTVTFAAQATVKLQAACSNAGGIAGYSYDPDTHGYGRSHILNITKIA